jgi:hypothetical protein
MKLSSAMSSVGSGLLSASTAILNSPFQTRIAEIDEEIKRLQEERDRLEKKLIK